jgi:hypothetical protein
MKQLTYVEPGRVEWQDAPAPSIDEEIVAEIRTQLAVHGAAGLSLRAVAREIGNLVAHGGGDRTAGGGARPTSQKPKVHAHRFECAASRGRPHSNPHDKPSPVSPTRIRPDALERLVG